MPDQHVILIGGRCAGKSTLGRTLAAHLRRPFLDTDVEIERRSGQSVAAIFAQDGEAKFRQLERELLATLTLTPPQVIAVGGGTVVDPANRARLRELGMIIFLNPGMVALQRRMRELASAGITKPALQGGNWIDEAPQVFASRLPIYRALANHEITADMALPALLEATLKIIGP